MKFDGIVLLMLVAALAIAMFSAEKRSANRD